MEIAHTQAPVMVTVPEPSSVTHMASSPPPTLSPEISSSAVLTITTTKVNTAIEPDTVTTLTPIPTLSVEQLGNLLSELMDTNADCELPCFWGVRPGITTVQEAKDIFENQGVEWGENTIILGYARGDGSFYYPDVFVSFSIMNDIVEAIRVEGTRDQYDLAFKFTEDWNQYNPAMMLARFGMPTEIYLASPFFAEANVPNEYQLSFSYPSLGIVIDYSIVAEALGTGRSKLCFAIDHVQKIFLNLNVPDDLNEQNISGPDMAENVKSWEEATGMSVEEFSDLLMDSENQKCVEVD